MLVQYKRNKRTVYYSSETLASAGGPEPVRRPQGPFTSCGGCPYASHGFVCYTREGDCMQTDMRRLDEKRKMMKEAKNQ